MKQDADKLFEAVVNVNLSITLRLFGSEAEMEKKFRCFTQGLFPNDPMAEITVVSIAEIEE